MLRHIHCFSNSFQNYAWWVIYCNTVWAKNPWDFLILNLFASQPQNARLSNNNRYTCVSRFQPQLIPSLRGSCFKIVGQMRGPRMHCGIIGINCPLLVTILSFKPSESYKNGKYLSGGEPQAKLPPERRKRWRRDERAASFLELRLRRPILLEKLVDKWI